MVTAAIEDLRTGQIYVYNPGLALITASIVKVQTLGTLLAQAQRANRGLTPQEQSLAAAMIEVSDNNAATALYQATNYLNNPILIFGRHIMKAWQIDRATWNIPSVLVTWDVIEHRKTG